MNLAQNTSAPLLGLLTAPLTLAVSPIASVNLLLWLAFPLSAFSMFVVLRHWVRWDLAAFVGGALYGFSPYMVTQAVSALAHGIRAPPPTHPVLPRTRRFDTTRCIRCDGEWRWQASVVAQFFISPEVAATSVLWSFCAAIVLAVRA